MAELLVLLMIGALGRFQPPAVIAGEGGGSGRHCAAEGEACSLPGVRQAATNDVREKRPGEYVVGVAGD